MFHQGTVSPAGLAAAAAASSALDLFQTKTPIEVAAAATTPQARASGQDAPPPPAHNRVFDAVAPAVVKTAAVEDEQVKKRASGAGVEAGATPGDIAGGAARATQGVEQYEGLLRGVGEGKRVSRDEKQEEEEALVPASAEGTRLQQRSDPQPVATTSVTSSSDHDESPPAMRGTLMPAKLATPQALLSPTMSPPDEAFQVAPDARGGDTGVSVAVAIVAPRDQGAALAALSPNAVMLSPGTDSDQGSTPSPSDLRRAEGLGGLGLGQIGGHGEEDKRYHADDEGSTTEGAQSARIGERFGGGVSGLMTPSSLSPWVATRQDASAAAEARSASAPIATAASKEQEQYVMPEARRVSDDAGGPAFGRGEAVTQSGTGSGSEFPMRTGTRTVSLSPESAASTTGAASGFAAGGGGRGRGGSSSSSSGLGPSSMGGSRAAEARGGLLAARAGNKRALGALDLMQVCVFLCFAQEIAARSLYAVVIRSFVSFRYVRVC